MKAFDKAPICAFSGWAKTVPAGHSMSMDLVSTLYDLHIMLEPPKFPMKKRLIGNDGIPS